MDAGAVAVPGLARTVAHWWGILLGVQTDADKLREIAARLNLSQRALADELELPERDLRHLFAGRGVVPRWLWLALAELERQRQ